MSNRTEIMGRGPLEIMGAFVGDDEVALAAEGGRSERQALARRTRSSSGYNSHWTYSRPAASSGEDLPKPTPEQIEELTLRASNGDARAAKILESLRRKPTSMQGEIELTPQERELVLKLHRTKINAALGDPQSVASWNTFQAKTYKEIQQQASSGNPKASRLLQIIDSLSGISPTPSESDQLTQLAEIERGAASKDLSAQQKLERVLALVKDLKQRAKQGDARAARAVEILRSRRMLGERQPSYPAKI